MKEDFVTYEIAKELKEKGFPQSSFHYFAEDGGICIPMYNFADKDMPEVAAPQIHEVLKWLRDERGIYVAIDFFRFNGNTELWWTYTVRYIEDDSTEDIFESCKRNSWEEAALAGVNYCLENLI